MRSPSTDPGRPPGLWAVMREDLRVVVERDPSIRNRFEALWHPALPAMWTHRLAHALHRHGRRFAARLLALAARWLTGVEVHPGAVLGRRVFIDHGTAVVIGETAVVGDDVTIYHQVTLGAVGWWRDCARPEGERRHPAVGDGVVLGTGATVLGPVRIGEHALVGAHALVTRDVPAFASVHAPAGEVLTGEVLTGRTRSHDPKPPPSLTLPTVEPASTQLRPAVVAAGSPPPRQ
jgi:serine O-acetyltransferase